MIKRFYLIVFTTLLLTGCSDDGYDDLIAFMADIKSRPSKPIEPIPTFNPYKPFDYGATILRAPFDKPIVIKAIDEIIPTGTEPPDPTRPKEFLEQFNIESLKMVGTLEQYGQLWALLDDGQGNVHYVKEGNYIGKHNGRIVTATPTYLQVIEVVSSGRNNQWVERPRTLELVEY